MNDQPTAPDGAGATAVQEPPPPARTPPPPPPAPRRDLRDRWRSAPRAVRWGALAAAALVLLLGVAVGSFALGRATAPDRGTGDGTGPAGTDPGGRFGDRPDLGFPPALPGQGTAPDGGGSSDPGTQSSWYVVPGGGGDVAA